MKEALKLEITHFDLVFNLPYFFETFKHFLVRDRKEITITAHLGNVYDENAQKTRKSRSLKLIQYTFDSMIEKLNINYVDVGLLQLVANLDDYRNMIKKGNLEYLKQLKKDGKIRAMGTSGHDPALLKKIIENSEFDVVMYTLNFITGNLDSTKKLIETCKKNQVALIAIKTFLRGKVFSSKKRNYPAYMSSGNNISMKLDNPATPAQCINYALDLGENSVVSGVRSIDELKMNVKLYQSEKESKSYADIASEFENTLYMAKQI
ncbi:MAG: hypothetical protein HeimC3_18160 [Candidatus Heimdallarchaeota archaeon LC_3]|nr:MAG: hypothetical protein HeimC3_18160 [Candidatus Heimdallarchaeota archaeon LC_3]